MPKVSVIVPVYNSAPFLPPCLSSLAGQTMRDFEILLIDNGSSDGGDHLCQEFADKDPRFRLLRQEKRGVSAARNMGLDAAVGQYLFFLDSDDALHPRALEELSAAADSYQADIALFGYKKMDTAQLAALLQNPPEDLPTWQLAQGETVKRWFHLEYLPMFALAGAKLLRREAVGSLRFQEDLALGEDTLFAYQLLPQLSTAVLAPQVRYYYRTHGGSATQSAALAKSPQYMQVPRLIRDAEQQRGNLDFALRWEVDILWRIAAKSWTMYRARDREGIALFDQLAREERQQSLYRQLSLPYKIYLRFRPFSYPAYCALAKLRTLWR
ncbi:glycosyltransferase family 2 protein [Acutalibacter intestini]|uniref:glycosyltransferase family 2 protein n=1 Tax=Acutalibacter intestini TaxID=3093659 RepID=UPI002AC8C065|nr:glycosyltransferase family 2 protein [Acutalibacter sp. M00204]